ncbi:TetR/AcrR family transcriptional regulator [soil metagenome]
MFRHYGIKSVTMDSLSAQLGISKKTVYREFADKNELVDAVFQDIIAQNQMCCNNDRASASNAIHELFLAMNMMQEMFEGMHASILYDLERNHPKTFEKFQQHKYKFLYQVIKENIERGKAEELYREDVDSDVATRIRLETIMLPFSPAVFPKNKYSLVYLQQQMVEYFLFALVTLKGYKLILNYKKQQKLK